MISVLNLDLDTYKFKITLVYIYFYEILILYWYVLKNIEKYLLTPKVRKIDIGRCRLKDENGN